MREELTETPRTAPVVQIRHVRIHIVKPTETEASDFGPFIVWMAMPTNMNTAVIDQYSTWKGQGTCDRSYAPSWTRHQRYRNQ